MEQVLISKGFRLVRNCGGCRERTYKNDNGLAVITKGGQTFKILQGGHIISQGQQSQLNTKLDEIFNNGT